MIKAIIVEDEVRGLTNLKSMLRQHCPQVEVIGEAGTLEDAEVLVNEIGEQINLAFLDINLPDGQIFELLDRIKPLSFNVIFVTAFDQFAVKAFEYASIGYILKPIDPFMLANSVERIRPQDNERLDERLSMFQQNLSSNKFDKITISAIDGLYFLAIKDILRIEADDNYSHIYTTEGQRFTVSKTIKYYEDLLKGDNFFRVHKSHIINLNYMKKFVKGDGGYVVMNDDKEITVSRRRRPAFTDRMRKLGAQAFG
ncbi:MAG: LytR/AlgR family response regulator transcription factor [Saprospiraceae bacterium]